MRLGAEELAEIFWEFGGERESRRFARAIVHDREQKKFETTRQLAELIERISPRARKKNASGDKDFQALRIAVNDEMGSLKRGLEAAVKILKPGGRLAVITFHSLEDRVVKEIGRERTRDYTFSGEVDVPELRHRARRNEMGNAQGDNARRNGSAGKSAQPQRAIAGTGKNVKWREKEKVSRRRHSSARRSKCNFAVLLLAAGRLVMSGRRVRYKGSASKNARASRSSGRCGTRTIR